MVDTGKWILPEVNGFAADPRLADLSGGTCVYLSTPRAKFLAGRYVESNWDMEKLEANKEKVVEEDLLKAKMALF